MALIMRELTTEQRLIYEIIETTFRLCQVDIICVVTSGMRYWHVD